MTWQLLVIFMVCCPHTDSLQVTMTADRAVVGQSGSIHCSADFQTDEVSPELEIRTSRSHLVFVWSQADNSSWLDTDAHNDRYTLRVDTSTDNTVVRLNLNINELGCGDEGSYICTAKVGVANTSIIVQSSQQVELRAEVPLAAPEKLALSQDIRMVKEHDWLDVECRAVVGHDNATRLTWQLDHGSHVEQVPPRDPRIIHQEVHNMSGEGDCLRQVTSKIRLVLSRKDHGCLVACFVWNPDLQPVPAPRCDREDKDLCAKTSRLQIHYGVTEESMQLYMVPESEVMEGSKVSLVCHAEGYPPANYSWTRSPSLTVSKHIAVLTQDTNSSHLVLSSFNSQTDSGMYKCTAWNWVMGVEFFSASQGIFLSSNSLAQKHLELQDLTSLKTFTPIELILLGVAISAVTIFIITLLVVLVTCIYRRRRRQRFQSPPTAHQPSLRQHKGHRHRSVPSSESPTVSASLQEENVTFSSGKLETPTPISPEPEPEPE